MKEKISLFSDVVCLEGIIGPSEELDFNDDFLLERFFLGRESERASFNRILTSDLLPLSLSDSSRYQASFTSCSKSFLSSLILKYPRSWLPKKLQLNKWMTGSGKSFKSTSLKGKKTKSIVDKEFTKKNNKNFFQITWYKRAMKLKRDHNRNKWRAKKRKKHKSKRKKERVYLNKTYNSKSSLFQVGFRVFLKTFVFFFLLPTITVQ